jgi:hypothetical protein
MRGKQWKLIILYKQPRKLTVASLILPHPNPVLAELNRNNEHNWDRGVLG